MFTLILNAGGQSRRMGQNKALLRVPPSGQLLLEHMVQRLAALPFDQILVVINQPDLATQFSLAQPVQFICDTYPGIGPLGGIATGLALCPTWALVLACDLPLVNPRVVQALATLTAELDPHGHFAWQAIVPHINGYAQPLQAFYHRSVLPVIAEKIAHGERRADSFLAAVRTRWVTEEELRPFDPNLYSFFNVNTPAEWTQACVLLKNAEANR